MAYLLDTHVCYWTMVGSPLLRATHRELLVETDEAIFVSAVSGWEIATKVRLGKWPEAASLVPGLERYIAETGLEPLPLTVAQAEIAGAFDVSHKDPFDRLLAAEALDRGLTTLAVDRAIDSFGCKVA